jgi:hypothetical protein
LLAMKNAIANSTHYNFRIGEVPLTNSSESSLGLFLYCYCYTAPFATFYCSYHRYCRHLQDVKEKPQQELCALYVSFCVPICQTGGAEKFFWSSHRTGGRTKFAKNLCASPFNEDLYSARSVSFDEPSRKSNLAELNT